MTTECYYSACPHHSVHDEPDEGPFCFEPECKATPDQQAEYEQPMDVGGIMRYPFTVLLMYPDYATDNYGEDTFLAHVDAHGPEEAVRVAQGFAYASYMDGMTIDDMTGDAEDFRVLCMFGGHLVDLAAGLQ